MTTVLAVSVVVLWIVVVVLAGVVVGLARQLGVLFERVAPAGALMIGRGPSVGDLAPPVRVEWLAGGGGEVGGPAPDGRHTLLLFLSPTCPVCTTLLPALRAIVRRERGWLRVVVASDGPREEHEAFARGGDLDPAAYALSTALGVAHQVSKLPYAVLLDAAGVVRARGLVNSREHLESLFEAAERGVASIQDWLETAPARAEGRG